MFGQVKTILQQSLGGDKSGPLTLASAASEVVAMSQLQGWLVRLVGRNDDLLANNPSFSLLPETE